MAEFNDVIDPFYKTDANYQKRLINFETGKFNLLNDHTQWLDKLLENTPETREFECHIYGYASKLGDTLKNQTLAYNRADAVADYLTAKNPKYIPRITKFESRGEEDPNYKAGESDNDYRWRAVEVHLKFDSPPKRKPGPLVIPKPRGMKWSVKGYPGYMHSVGAGQFGVAIYKFRNDEVMKEHLFFSPQFGAGADILSAIKWIKFLKDKGQIVEKIAEEVIEKLVKSASYPNSRTFTEIIKEIVKSLVSGGSIPFEYSWMSCKVYQPLTFNRLNLQTIGGGSGSAGVYSTGHTYVYGKVWYKETSGKEMLRTQDLLDFESGGKGYQFPGLGISGGPLIML